MLIIMIRLHFNEFKGFSLQIQFLLECNFILFLKRQEDSFCIHVYRFFYVNIKEVAFLFMQIGLHLNLIGASFTFSY
jgi:hypothetical protein